MSSSCAISNKTKKKINYDKRKRVFFIFGMLIIPILFFCVFNFGVKINSVLLSLKTYDSGEYIFTGFNNFKKVISDLNNNYEVKISIKNSTIFYLVGLLITMPLSIFTSFFIYKKIPGNGFFKVMAYIPQMLSTIILTLMYKYFVDKMIPIIYQNLGYEAPDVFYGDLKIGVLIFFNIWANLGSTMILYLGSMSRIPDELVEVGQLEGLSLWKEFWLVTVPLIFPTITVFIVSGVAGFFTHQCYVYNFYGAFAPQEISNIGYYMFTKVVGETSTLASYPYASAFGVLFTLLAAPITLLVKYLLEKFGPGAEF